MSLIKNILDKNFASLKDYTEERIASIVAGKIISKKDEFLNKVRGLGEKMKDSEEDDESSEDNEKEEKTKSKDKEPDGDESREDTDDDGDRKKEPEEKKENKFPFKKK
jgi:hypothetical protein